MYLAREISKKYSGHQRSRSGNQFGNLYGVTGTLSDGVATVKGDLGPIDGGAQKRPDEAGGIPPGPSSSFLLSRRLCGSGAAPARGPPGAVRGGWERGPTLSWVVTLGSAKLKKGVAEIGHQREEGNKLTQMARVYLYVTRTDARAPPKSEATSSYRGYPSDKVLYGPLAHKPHDFGDRKISYFEG